MYFWGGPFGISSVSWCGWLFARCPWRRGKWKNFLWPCIGCIQITSSMEKNLNLSFSSNNSCNIRKSFEIFNLSEDLCLRVFYIGGKEGRGSQRDARRKLHCPAVHFLYFDFRYFISCESHTVTSSKLPLVYFSSLSTASLRDKNAAVDAGGWIQQTMRRQRVKASWCLSHNLLSGSIQHVPHFFSLFHVTHHLLEERVPLPERVG